MSAIFNFAHVSFPFYPLPLFDQYGSFFLQESLKVMLEHLDCFEDEDKLQILNGNSCERSWNPHRLSPLTLACEYADYKSVCLLLKHGANVEGHTNAYPVESVFSQLYSSNQFSVSSQFLHRIRDIFILLTSLMTWENKEATLSLNSTILECGIQEYFPEIRVPTKQLRESRSKFFVSPVLEKLCLKTIHTQFHHKLLQVSSQYSVFDVLQV